MTSYTTTQDDTWDSIAFRLWGREHLMNMLLQANPDFADILVFPAGVVLAVPDVDLTATINPVSELPPWM